MARKQYRVEVPENHMGVELRAADGSWLSGRPTDLTIGGSGVRFSLEMLGAKCPNLALGADVVLRFTAPHLADPVVINARVAHRSEDGDARHFGLQFTAREQLDRTLPPELFRLFNRRESFRVDAEPGTVPVQIEHPGDAPLEGTLINLSATGVGVRFPADVEAALEGVDEITMFITLPGETRPLDISGTIRNRRLVDDDVCYGVSFDEADADGHASALSAYIMIRQRQMLRMSRTR